MKITDINKLLTKHKNKSYRRNEKIEYIVLHHTFNTPMGEVKDFQALARYHVLEKDYPGIGYHYGVSPEGLVYKLQRHDLARVYHIDTASKSLYSNWEDHVLNRHGLERPSNRNSIGIVLPGDFSNTIVPSAQWYSAIDLCKILVSDHGATIIGHRDVPGSDRQKIETDCPGVFFDMTAFIREVRGKDTYDVATPYHIRRYHELSKKLKESGNEEAVRDLMALRRHITYV